MVLVFEGLNGGSEKIAKEKDSEDFGRFRQFSDARTSGRSEARTSGRSDAQASGRPDVRTPIFLFFQFLRSSRRGPDPGRSVEPGGAGPRRDERKNCKKTTKIRPAESKISES